MHHLLENGSLRRHFCFEHYDKKCNSQNIQTNHYQHCREYYPQNIMYDKRVHRGNSYAAMVIPAGTNHDTMIMEKRQSQTVKRRTFKPGDRVS